MCLPAKIQYSTVAEYRKHFEDTLCQGPVYTFDGVPVRFRKRDFDHCMYESPGRNDIKDQFSTERAERIGLIKETLENDSAELYQGWDKERKRVDPSKRVAVAYENYVVVINIRKNSSGDHVGDFVTAYLADNSISKIRANPIWPK